MRGMVGRLVIGAIAALGTFGVASHTSALPAEPDTVDVDYFCFDGDGYVSVIITGGAESNTYSITVLEDAGQGATIDSESGVPAGAYTLGPLDDGAYDLLVVWDQNSGTPLNDESFTVDCDEGVNPIVALATSCRNDEAFLQLSIIDDDEFYDYAVTIDGVEIDDEMSDTGGQPVEFGPYPIGTQVAVEVFWNQGNRTLIDTTVTLNCDDEEEGGGPTSPAPGLPETGPRSMAPLALGGALVVAGLALMGSRRWARD